MITSNHCPECKGTLADREPPAAHFPWPWRYCRACGWDEKYQMQEKIREEIANGPKPFDLE